MSNRWGYKFIFIKDEDIKSFDRYNTVARLSKSGRRVIEKILYIRNNDREKFDHIEQQLRSKERFQKGEGVMMIDDRTRPIKISSRLLDH